MEYVRTTAVGNPGYETILPPNQYAVGTEPPPPYTCSEKWVQPELNVATPEQTTGASPSSAGATLRDAPSSPHIPGDSVPATVNPAYEDNESSTTPGGAAAAPFPNIPPPLYDELPPVSET